MKFVKEQAMLVTQTIPRVCPEQRCSRTPSGQQELPRARMSSPGSRAISFLAGLQMR